jgi:hypothetical protein
MKTCNKTIKIGRLYPHNAAAGKFAKTSLMSKNSAASGPETRVMDLWVSGNKEHAGKLTLRLSEKRTFKTTPQGAGLATSGRLAWHHAMSFSYIDWAIPEDQAARRLQGLDIEDATLSGAAALTTHSYNV